MKYAPYPVTEKSSIPDWHKLGFDYARFLDFIFMITKNMQIDQSLIQQIFTKVKRVIKSGLDIIYQVGKSKFNSLVGHNDVDKDLKKAQIAAINKHIEIDDLSELEGGGVKQTYRKRVKQSKNMKQTYRKRVKQSKNMKQTYRKRVKQSKNMKQTYRKRVKQSKNMKQTYRKRVKQSKEYKTDIS